MKQELILSLQNNFNDMANILEGTEVEYWYARELQKILGYQKWDKFLNVIEKAKIACENSNIEVFDHFRHVGKMVSIGSGATREIADIMLTRSAEDLEKLERKVKSDEKKLIKKSALPKR
jgi:DNA-damage-inducible protein D